MKLAHLVFLGLAFGRKLVDLSNSTLPICQGTQVAKTGSDEWQCVGLGGIIGDTEAERRCTQSYDSDASKASYMQCYVNKISSTEFNCLASKRCKPVTRPSSCTDLESRSFGGQEFVRIIDWDKGISANNGVTFDATKDCVNALFRQNGGVWLMEVSPDGSNFYEWSVYKQTQVRPGFDAHGYIYKWRSSSNLINKQFELYSDVNDAISGTSKWARCNYDDANAGFGRDCCCRSPTESFEPGRGGGGWGFFAPSRYRPNIRWLKIRFSMPLAPLTKVDTGLPSSCGMLDTMSFGAKNAPFAKIIDWDKSISANKGVSFDATKDCVNALFQQNGGVWLMEVSPDGKTFHEWSVYKQTQVRDGFDAYGYIYQWRSINNLIHKQFELYSDVNDAISGTSKWARCNYDDANAGFGRDCCCRSPTKSFEPKRGGGGWGFFAPSRYRSNIRWSKIRFSMPLKSL